MAEFDISHILRVSQVPECVLYLYLSCGISKVIMKRREGGVKVYSLNKSPYLNSLPV